MLTGLEINGITAMTMLMTIRGKETEKNEFTFALLLLPCNWSISHRPDQSIHNHLHIKLPHP
ncbi:CLUMA_CG009603, isoform A [Clunio marinus]|uniref:CLUMA_CG009603, isoform A n=1 Tax=Clunio marinus TaxID=568069 RepID=A0A1J1IB26_9DIPT|nr:CLUMA_CG009603, isoform A [Clunio marinus]